MLSQGKRIAFGTITLFVPLAVILGLLEVAARVGTTRVIEEGGSAIGCGAEEASERLSALRYRTLRGIRVCPNARILVKNHITSSRDVVITTNSLGFRSEELADPKPNTELRILAIGDSITFASHLPASEVYVAQLEELLNARNPERRVRVINAGIGDTGTRESVSLLEELGYVVDPDIVLLEFYLNDSRPPWGFPGELGAPGWWRRHSVVAHEVFRRLKLRQWIRRTGENRFRWIDALSRLDWQNDPTAFRELASLARYDWGAAWQHESWSVVERELERVARLSAEWGFDVAVVAFPVAYQVYASFVDDEPQRRVSEIADALGLQFLDLLPALRSLGRRDLFYDQCHGTPETNRVFAREIAAFLESEGLVEDSR